VAFEERGDAGDQAPVELAAHDLAIEAFFGLTVLADLAGVQVGADQVADDFIVVAAVHPVGERVGGLDSEIAKILRPDANMNGVGVDDDSVKVENERFQRHRDVV
jgi:hypothetical protein